MWDIQFIVSHFTIFILFYENSSFFLRISFYKYLFISGARNDYRKRYHTSLQQMFTSLFAYAFLTIVLLAQCTSLLLLEILRSVITTPAKLDLRTARVHNDKVKIIKLQSNKMIVFLSLCCVFNLHADILTANRDWSKKHTWGKRWESIVLCAATLIYGWAFYEWCKISKSDWRRRRKRAGKKKQFC